MNFRGRVDMLVLFPKRQLAVFKDNSMPKRDWSKYDEPTVTRRKGNRVRSILRKARAQPLPAFLVRQAS